jgi:hypothetical protein
MVNDPSCIRGAKSLYPLKDSARFCQKFNYIATSCNLFVGNKHKLMRSGTYFAFQKPAEALETGFRISNLH